VQYASRTTRQPQRASRALTMMGAPAPELAADFNRVRENHPRMEAAR
jgi:hypothetical protein